MTRINHQGAASRPRLPPRITLLASNSKYKFKEERKRILKLSVKKLRSIEDPEAFLSRSVLINNTLKRLQSEVREEKAKKTTTTTMSLQTNCHSVASDQMPTYNPSPYSFYSIEKAYREEMERSSSSSATGSSSLDNNGNDSNMVTSSFPASTQGRSYDQHMFDADDEEEEEEEEDNASQSSQSTSGSDTGSGSSDEDEEPATTANDNAKDNTNNNTTTSTTMTTVSPTNVEDDLLAEVYMPTPCSMPPMIASIDSEDDLHLRPLPLTNTQTSERPSTPVPWTSTSGPQNPSAEAVMKESSCDNEDIWSEAVRTECWTKPVDAQTSSNTALRPSTVNTNTWPSVDWPTYTPNSPTSSVTMSSSSSSSMSTMSASVASTSSNAAASNGSFSPNISAVQTAAQACSSQHKENLFVHDKSLSDKCYSCGQSSLFQSELQSVVFNSLIASLET